MDKTPWYTTAANWLKGKAPNLFSLGVATGGAPSPPAVAQAKPSVYENPVAPMPLIFTNAASKGGVAISAGSQHFNTNSLVASGSDVSPGIQINSGWLDKVFNVPLPALASDETSGASGGAAIESDFVQGNATPAEASNGLPKWALPAAAALLGVGVILMVKG